MTKNRPILMVALLILVLGFFVNTAFAQEDSSITLKELVDRSKEGLEKVDKKLEKSKGISKEKKKTVASSKRSESIQEKADPKVKEEFENLVQSLYRDARSLIKRGLYDQAKPILERVARLFPHYQNTDKYLERIKSEGSR